jgi:hypothetical protein
MRGYYGEQVNSGERGRLVRCVARLTGTPRKLFGGAAALPISNLLSKTAVFC